MPTLIHSFHFATWPSLTRLLLYCYVGFVKSFQYYDVASKLCLLFNFYGDLNKAQQGFSFSVQHQRQLKMAKLNNWLILHVNFLCSENFFRGIIKRSFYKLWQHRLEIRDW